MNLKTESLRTVLKGERLASGIIMPMKVCQKIFVLKLFRLLNIANRCLKSLRTSKCYNELLFYVETNFTVDKSFEIFETMLLVDCFNIPKFIDFVFTKRSNKPKANYTLVHYGKTCIKNYFSNFTFLLKYVL
jgi:hypothetical protein